MKRLLFDEHNGSWEDSNLNLSMSHTQEQFIRRIFLVNIKSPKCLNGQCFCGCDTPSLFLANKGCEGYLQSNEEIKEPCYEPMMNKEDWRLFKEQNQIDIQSMFEFLKSEKLI